MKRTVFFIAMMLATTVGFSQLLTENFTATTFPPTGWTVDVQSGNWSRVATNNAGGAATGEARLNWTPSFTATTRFISPLIDLTGKPTVALSFKHMMDWYSATTTIGVATRTGTGGTWTSVWSQNVTANIAATSVNVLINNANTNLANFQFCIYFNGLSDNIDYWYIDDINLSEAVSLDGAMSIVTVPSYIVQGNTNITGKILNSGTTNLTGFNVNYKVDGGATQTTAVTGQNLAFGSTYTFTCSQQWNATPGNHTLKVWVDGPNGGTDLNHANDTITSTISVATQSVTRFPLFEEFTSSTCAPCASFNSSTFTPFITAHPGEFALIKYQMNWPSPGDIYYTAEGGVRRGFYGVSAVPDLFIDGAGSSMTSGGMLTELTTEAAKPTFFAITATPTYTGTTVNIPVTITPYVSGSFKVLGVVNEKTTTGNVGSNGETSFKHVMMKMFPNGSGSTITFTAGTPYTTTFTQDMSTTNMEEMTDLEVVVLVQSNTTMEVFQSLQADIIIAGINEAGFENLGIYPNPSNSIVNVFNAENADLSVYDVYGKEVFNASKITSNYQINVADFAAGAYVIKLSRDGNVTTKRIAVVK